MNKRVRIVVPLLALQIFAGCIAVKIPQSADYGMHLQSETKRISRAEVEGVDPLLERDDHFVSVKVDLLGDFEVATTTVYANSRDWDDYMAVGFFPGVMSCEGEYRECFKNAACAFFYNLVFAGLPTVHGLLVEPCIPYYPEQTGSVVGKSAFLKSALIGFSRYSKPALDNTVRKVNRAKLSRIALEDATISAPALGIASGCGMALQIPINRLPAGGEVKVKLELPASHPLKSAMAEFEDVEITIQCDKKSKED